jgi:diguanylate cyclase (GGDEF)-like protein
MEKRPTEMIDPMTNTLSQDCFKFILELEGRLATRYNYFLSLLTIEMDQNDDEGLLVTLADLVRKSIRISDILSRSDDQRLSVILPHAETSGAFGVGKRIRDRVRNYKFLFKNGFGKRTVSVGGGCFPTHTSDIHALLSIANDMLSKAKRAGGNQVYL